MPRNRRKTQEREKCDHPDCVDLPALTLGSLKRHKREQHRGHGRPARPCCFCNLLVNDSSCSSHMSALHCPTVVYRSRSKERCPDCQIAWRGSNTAIENHKEACLSKTISDFMFSQVLGVWLRPTANVQQTYNYYSKAVQASSSWASQLTRRFLPDESSRLGEFKKEIESYLEALKHEDNASFAGYDHLSPIFHDPSFHLHDTWSLGGADIGFSTAPCAVPEPLSTVPFDSASHNSSFPLDPSFGASEHNQWYNPYAVPYVQPVQGWHSLSRPNLTLRKAALYRIPI